MLLPVLAVPVVVDCDRTIGETACRYSVPVEISDAVPDVLPSMDAADMPALEMVIVDAPVDSAMPGPADMTIVPTELANPLALIAFRPDTEMVIEPIAVAVCRLTFAPAAMARLSADPAMLVPLADMVFVPAAAPAPPMMLMA
jgi:hypothetical protein